MDNLSLGSVDDNDLICDREVEEGEVEEPVPQRACNIVGFSLPDPYNNSSTT